MTSGLWALSVAMTLLAVALLTGPEGSGSENAFAQLPTSAGARGVFAFSGQLTKNTYGIFMVDVDTMTLWAYEYVPNRDCMRLVAARTWRYDRYLENFNGCDLPPERVEEMIEQQRRDRIQMSEQQMP